MPDYKLTDDGKWVENTEEFMFPAYILDYNGHWVQTEEER